MPWATFRRLSGILAMLVGLAALTLGGCVLEIDNTDRKAQQVSLSGAPNGVWWSAATHGVYITDDTANRIQFRGNDGRISTTVQLTTAPASGANLGQVVRDADGRLFVTRFGFGTDGAIDYADVRGAAAVVVGPATSRRRIGLWPVSANTYVVSWFERLADNSQRGAVSLLTLDLTANPIRGTERELVTGLVKPVGVAVQGNTLYVGDQSVGKIYAADLAQALAAPLAVSSLRVLATVENDQFTIGPRNDLFTGGRDGVIRRITPGGSVSEFATGFQQILGVTYDAENRRLFAAERGAGSQSLRILPVD